MLGTAENRLSVTLSLSSLLSTAFVGTHTLASNLHSLVPGTLGLEYLLLLKCTLHTCASVHSSEQ